MLKASLQAKRRVDAGRPLWAEKTEDDQDVTPFVQLLVKAVRSVRAAGLQREPSDASSKGPERDWETLGRNLGRAVRQFRGERRDGR